MGYRSGLDSENTCALGLENVCTLGYRNARALGLLYHRCSLGRLMCDASPGLALQNSAGLGLALRCGVDLGMPGCCCWRLGLSVLLGWAAEVAASWAASKAYASWVVA